MGTQKRKLYVPSGGRESEVVREGFSGSSLDLPIGIPGSVGTDMRLVQRAWNGPDFRVFRKFFQMTPLPPALMQSDGEPLKVLSKAMVGSEYGPEKLFCIACVEGGRGQKWQDQYVG